MSFQDIFHSIFLKKSDKNVRAKYMIDMYKFIKYISDKFFPIPSKIN